MNTDGKKESMENENGRKNEKYFDIARGQAKHLKVNKQYNKSSRDILKEIEMEVLEEDEWLGNLHSLLRCPFGNQKDLNNYGTQFISVIQSDSYLKEVANINLRVNTLKDHVGSRLFCDSRFSWFIEVINRKCRNVLAFSFLEEFEGDTWMQFCRDSIAGIKIQNQRCWLYF